jgi:MFS family permease
MTCTVGPMSAAVIDVVHPGVRATGSSVLSLFQNLLGLAAGPFIAGLLSDAWTLQHALTAMPLFSLLAAAMLLMACRSFEADLTRASLASAQDAFPTPQAPRQALA